ncbi:MAG: TRAP transporter substrate-binding protein [Pleomorphochaeta sp.]
MKKLMVVLIVCLIGSFAFASGTQESSGEKVLKFKLAENQPAKNPISEGMMMFADLVKEKTNGSVEIEVYTDAQLGDEVSTIAQIEAGTLDFARVNTSALASTADEVGVFTLPYVFINQTHKYKVLDGKPGQDVIKALEKYNMIGLRYWEAGSRCFYTTDTPIKSVADMAGLKIRVQQNEVAMKMVELLGAKATPMAYGEVFQGLQTGVVDGAENDYVSYYTSGHYEVAKNYSVDAHMAPPAIVLCSKNAWNKMNAEQQQAVKDAAEEASIWQRKAMNDYQDVSKQAAIDSGCTIYEVDTTEFQAAVSEIYDMYPQYSDILQEIKDLQ